MANFLSQLLTGLAQGGANYLQTRNYREEQERRRKLEAEQRALQQRQVALQEQRADSEPLARAFELMAEQDPTNLQTYLERAAQARRGQLALAHPDQRVEAGIQGAMTGLRAVGGPAPRGERLPSLFHGIQRGPTPQEQALKAQLDAQGLAQAHRDREREAEQKFTLTRDEQSRLHEQGLAQQKAEEAQRLEQLRQAGREKLAEMRNRARAGDKDAALYVELAGDFIGAGGDYARVDEYASGRLAAARAGQGTPQETPQGSPAPAAPEEAEPHPAAGLPPSPEELLPFMRQRLGGKFGSRTPWTRQALPGVGAATTPPFVPRPSGTAGMFPHGTLAQARIRASDAQAQAATLRAATHVQEVEARIRDRNSAINWRGAQQALAQDRLELDRDLRERRLDLEKWKAHADHSLRLARLQLERQRLENPRAIGGKGGGSKPENPRIRLQRERIGRLEAQIGRLQTEMAKTGDEAIHAQIQGLNRNLDDLIRGMDALLDEEARVSVSPTAPVVGVRRRSGVPVLPPVGGGSPDMSGGWDPAKKALRLKHLAGFQRRMGRRATAAEANEIYRLVETGDLR